MKKILSVIALLMFSLNISLMGLFELDKLMRYEKLAEGLQKDLELKRLKELNEQERLKRIDALYLAQIEVSLLQELSKKINASEFVINEFEDSLDLSLIFNDGKNFITLPLPNLVNFVIEQNKINEKINGINIDDLASEISKDIEKYSCSRN